MTNSRVRLMAWALGVTAAIAMPLQLVWPSPSNGMQFSYYDIAPDREHVWIVLSAFAVLLVVNLPLLAWATLHLVTARGGHWATAGAAVLLLGCGFQAAGVAAWGSVYYFATHADLDPATGRAMVEVVNEDEVHLYGLWAPGALLVTLGTVLLCVALVRAKVVSALVPVGLLFIVVSWVIPSVGLLGLVVTVPTTLGAVGLAWCVHRGEPPGVDLVWFVRIPRRPAARRTLDRS